METENEVVEAEVTEEVTTENQVENETTTEEVTETLYDLPDGRKVPGDQVKAEYENLLKDYTQKSQKLADYERISKPSEDNVPEWKKEGYVPKSYAEIIELAKKSALEDIQNQAIKAEQQTKQIAEQVASEIAEIKKTDPKINEDALFAHANKYQFRDLKQAHVNFKAMEEAKLTAEQRTIKNLRTRETTPIAGQPGVTSLDGAIKYGEHQNYGSAIEYLQSRKS